MTERTRPPQRAARRGGATGSWGPAAALLGLLGGALLLAVRHDPAGPPPARSLAGAARGWNVLLLSIDTLRADRLGAYGYTRRPTSPRLDALIGSGVRFAWASAPRALTWPSLASVLTGLYPSGHGVAENGYGLGDATPTLPKLLGAAGYRTAAFLGNMCRANHQGWETFFCAAGRDPDLNREALAWAARSGRERPFFLWIHYFGAHGPYYNGGGFARAVADPGYRGPVAANKAALNRIMTERIPLGPADRAQLDALYDAAVMGTDHNVAELLAGFAAAGRLERTVIVLLADHGEELYDHHGYIYHACSVYESGLHVPLAFAAPGLLPAATATAAVELIDVTPTLLDLLGIPSPPDLHGRSLAPLLARPDGDGDAGRAFSEYGTTRIRTARAGRFKLIVNPDGYDPICFEGAPPGLYPIGGAELYDLAADPGETRDLAAADPARVGELAALLAARFATVAGEAAAGQVIPEDLQRELEALGYLVR